MKAHWFIFSQLGVFVTPTSSSALDVGFSEYRWVSELAAEGFEPFASSGRNGELFGMRKAAELLLCYARDNEFAAQVRQEQMNAEVNGGSADRKVQNIPVACVQLR